jgi:hypothetical protein
MEKFVAVVLTAIASAMKLPSVYAAVAAVASLLAAGSMAALDKPDVYGAAAIVNAYASSPEIRFGVVQGSFTPSFRNVEWQHVPIDQTRIRVEVMEKDMVRDDPVGTFELGPEILHRASDAGRVLPVPVGDQTTGQILFASISVLLESTSPDELPSSPAR